MPTCDFCGRTEASANMRRRRAPHTGHWRCKDKLLCNYRVKQTKQANKEKKV